MEKRGEKNYLADSSVTTARFSGPKVTGYTPAAISNPLRPNHYVLRLGVICRKEMQFEKSTKIPLRLRLGSLQYCNMLEGK